MYNAKNRNIYLNILFNYKKYVKIKIPNISDFHRKSKQDARNTYKKFIMKKEVK